MNNFLPLILCVLISIPVFSRGGAPNNEADYIVPTSPEFVSYSRFKVIIIDRFKGPETQKISYVFPEFLIGEANRVISLQKVVNSENSWTSPELNAHCTIIEDDFSCNMYIRKGLGSRLLTVKQAMAHLSTLNLSEEQLKGLTGVINAFYSHEPAGFLTYDID